MQYGFKLKESNDANWWKIHESCLLAVSSVKPILQELHESNMLEVDLNVFINQVVIACLHESYYPFLVGRALFTASRFPKLINKETLLELLKVTANALSDNQNPIIRVSAMKSIYCFCEELSNENQEQILVPHLAQIIDGLIQMISQNSTNQIGYLTLETLLVVLGVNEEFVGSIENKICPFAIALFIKNTNDPLVSSLISDLIKNLLTNPFTNEKMEQRLLPTLISILNTTISSKLQNINADQKDFSTLLTVKLIILFLSF
jgi:importin-9